MNILAALRDPAPVEPVEPVDLETRALTHVEQARTVLIADQRTYDVAVEILLANKALQREIVDHHAPIKKAQYDAWQVTLAQERKVLDPLQQAEKILKVTLETWDVIQKRLRVEQERVAREAAEVERAREVAAEAREAEVAGAPPEEVQAIIEQPRPVPVPVVPPSYQRSSAAPATTTYGCEVFDLKLLCRAIGDESGTTSTELVMGLERDKESNIITSPALERMAKALKSTFVVPGCRVLVGSRVSARLGGRK